MKPLEFNPTDINKDDIIEDLVEDPILRGFFIKNDLDTSFIEDHLSAFLNYKLETERCTGCEGMHVCKQDVLGHEPVIKMVDGGVKTYYQECHFYATRRSQAYQQEHIDALYMPKMIYDASLEDFDFTKGENRPLIHNRLTNFITKYLKGEPVKGLYLHGQYQKGKTYCLGALANELSKRGVHVVLAYYPDLVREFKSRINNNTVEDLISKLKQVDVLMFDDIGGEAPSPWIRDEVLGPILQHRLLDHKPTFFTSNVPQRGLLDLMTFTSQKADQMKAARIDARIQSLSEEIKL
jgi:primosomal protein DnaI